MTLQLSKGRPYKAYVKKLNNGFGIKTINTLTGVENILLITADSLNNSHSDKKIMDPQCLNLKPLLSKSGEETATASMSLPNINKPNYAINKVLAQLEPYLREIKPDIAGFHLFDEGNTKPSLNVQETSVIFVANTELARKRGVHFNIPGKLINVFFLDDQTKEGKIKFKADSVVKPLTIVVSDYVLHINICYDSPSKPQIKTVGTQTKKRYVLSSSVDHNKPTYKIESLLLSDLQVRPEQKSTQTDGSILKEEQNLSQMNLNKQYQDASIQTVFFKDQISYTSMASSDKKSFCFMDKSGLNTDDGNTQIDSFDSLKQTIDYENSQSSFTSYDSHEHSLYQTKVLDQEVTGRKVYKTISAENEEVKENTEAQTTTDKIKEKKMFTLFDNSSNYNIKIANSHSMHSKHSNNLTGVTSSTSTSNDGDRSELSVKKTHSDNGVSPQVSSIENSSNMSIKDLKERLNKTKLSLQQLYSVVDFLETKSVNRSSSETSFQTPSYFEREKLKNKSRLSSKTSVVMTSQATLEESIRIDSSDQCSYFHETRLGTNHSNSTSDYEKSPRDSKGTLSSVILCERCGSFHTDDGFEGVCTIFGETQILDYKGSLVTIDSSSSPTSKENVFKNVQNVSSTGSILQDEIGSYGSSDQNSNETESGLETKITDSIMSTKEHNYSAMSESSQYNKSNHQEATKLADSSTDELGNGDAQKSPEESYQCLMDYDIKLALNKNHSTFSDIKQLEERNFVHREECELDEISVFDHSLADFDKACKVDRLCSQTSREIKDTLNNSISSNENCILEEFIGSATTESNNSNHNFTSSQDTFEENDKTPSYSTISSNQNTELMGDKKGIEEYNGVKNAKVSNSVLLLSNLTLSVPTRGVTSYNTTTLKSENKTETKENGKILYFTEVRNTKSWISFKKSLKSCNFNDKFGLKEKATTSEPTTNQQKTKHLSSGDHLCQNKLCKVSSRLENSINTIRLFNNKSNFLKHKYSSSSTVHIIPSSTQELMQLKSQESSFQNRVSSKKAIEKTESKSLRFGKWFVKSRGNCNKQNGKSENTIKSSPKYKFENKFVANKTDLKNCKSSQKSRTIKENKYAENKNSKHKKNNLFCFFR